MGFPWKFFGLSMGFQRDVYEMSIGFLLNLHEVSMEFYRISMGLFWGLLWISMRF